MEWPTYPFALPVDDPTWWFAWRPVRTATGRRAWLRWVLRRRMVVKFDLSPGGGDTFWSYMHTTEGE